MLRASIVVIGDELLGGFVQDVNSHFLARRLHANSVPLDRVQVVPDTFADIDEALQAELVRPRPRVVLTTGGIGSTPDDITFEAVARSLGREVVEHPALVQRLEGALQWTRDQGLEVDDQFRHQFLRMARIPIGAELVRAAGWAPCVQVDVEGGSDDEGGATVVVLPGVPGQMRQIVHDGIEPDLLAGRNEPWHTVELEHGYPESVLNPMFAVLGRDHPRVQLGSYPGQPMLVRLKGPPGAVEAAASYVRGRLAELDGSRVGHRLRAAWADRFGGGDGSSDDVGPARGLRRAMGPHGADPDRHDDDPAQQTPGRGSV